MFELFQMGGPFMVWVLILILAGLAYCVFVVIKARSGSFQPALFKMIKSIGLFIMVFGVLLNFLNLYAIFDAFAIFGEGETIPNQLLFEGLKLASLPGLFGFVGFLIFYVIFFAFEFAYARRIAAQ